MPDRIEAFIGAVAAEIRWKKARPVLTEEIRTHLLDQRDAYAAQGMTEDAAQAEAVRQMGDPVALGTDLDRIHRPRPQWGLLALALALVALAGPALGAAVERIVWFFTFRSTLWPVAALGAAFAVLGAAIPLAVSRMASRRSVVDRLRQE